MSKPEVVSFEEADKRLDGVLSASFQGDYERVALLQGSFSVDGNLEKAVAALVKGKFDLIAITGDLKAARIRLYENTPGLYVGGTTTAETLEGGDAEVYIQDGSFTYFVYGYYNDGILETGRVETPWVINSNHDLRVTAGEGTTWIDNYGDDDDYDFGSETIGSSFVPAVLDDDEEGIDIDAFYEQLVKGKPVLLPTAKTGRELALASVASAVASNQTELVIETTKLKKFPADALKIAGLKRLVLDGNDIKKLPAEISQLTELEELSIVNCGLAELPDEIGALTKLRILKIDGNSGDEGAIRIPSSIGNLVNLEELDVSNLSEALPEENETRLADMSTFELPASAAKLVKLRVLRANHTTLVLPQAMWGLASLVEIEMSGGSWAYLKAIPAWITSFPNLVKLDLSSNFFSTIPDLAPLAKLEELSFGNALGFVKQLPDLSQLPKLRKLNVSGNTDHTGVAVPPHDVLRQLFAMKLPALEDLRIDRWGKEPGRKNLDAEVIAGIGAFEALKRIDLEFDGLKSLPADLYALPAIESLSLGYNRLSKAEVAKVKKAFPKADIDVGDQE